ncbi:glycosyltransferase family 4 protein [Yoonia sp. F2084L]|uniref:glycosyltransferase family 4 protein n=1 Tax=Yoonia sp. F2084L TaxID=2926419 RepID=UPI001FF2656C|nr:glycosyltransferase family 4 protein [Yoonia sp. F2084L]MCK0097146.1 glycosyltransferase family 4 protein [Yoonia sp. F2084L]
MTQHILLLASYAPSLINFRGPLIRDLVAAGHQVSVAAPDMTQSLQGQLAVLGAKVHDTPLNRTGTGIFADLRYAVTLRRVIRDVRPDVVLTYTIKPNIWGAFAAAWVGVPSIAMVTGLGYAFTDAGEATIKQRIVRTISRRLYRAATRRNARVIFQNPDDRDDFCAAGCLDDQSKIGMVDGSGVDMAHYAPAPLPSEPSFLMIARLLKNKGVREYAQAAALVRQTHPHARFVLAGPFDDGPDGIDAQDLQRWQDAGLAYLGGLDDVRPAMREAQVYVLPSYREGTPRSVLEAMAMGRPVITSDAPGCRETVQDGVNGFLVPLRDPDALAARMRDMIDDPGRTARMGQEGLRIAQEKYDVRKVNQTLMGYLDVTDMAVHSIRHPAASASGGLK